MCNCWCLVMAASLAFLGIVRALTIDNQITILRNDCYEKMAIGQRLDSKDVYKSFNFSTVADCRSACTKEKSACKAFSFGISAKGNGTCELSLEPVKETAELKPIGTVANIDFDLYIKKLGCSIVTDTSTHQKPSEETHLPPSKPDTLGNINGYKHPDNQYQPHEPPDRPPPSLHYLPEKPIKDSVEHVQTLVSVASGPQSYLHPIHDIIVGQNLYQYGGGYDQYIANMPPFRPPALNQPYDNDRIDHGPPQRPKVQVVRNCRDPRPVQDYNYNRPDPEYGNRPVNLRPLSGYSDDDRFEPSRPQQGFGRPSPIPRPISLRPNSNYGDFEISDSSDLDRYDNLRPPRPNDRFRPIPHRYGSVIPHPDEYKKPFKNDYLLKPGSYEDRPPQRPNFRPEDEYNLNYSYQKPTRPFQQEDNSRPTFSDNTNYDRPSRPSRPFQQEDNTRPSFSGTSNYDRPSRPTKPFQQEDNTKPSFSDNPNYDRPSIKPVLKDQNNAYGPTRPVYEPGDQNTLNRPFQDNGYNERPSSGKPFLLPSRPSGGQSSYGTENTTGGKPIVTHSIGYGGAHITSIITEIKDGK